MNMIHTFTHDTMHVLPFNQVHETGVPGVQWAVDADGLTVDSRHVGPVGGQVRGAAVDQLKNITIALAR